MKRKPFLKPAQCAENRLARSKFTQVLCRRENLVVGTPQLHKKILQFPSLKQRPDQILWRSNLMLDAQTKSFKQRDKENVSHKPAIEEANLQKLKSSEVFHFFNHFPCWETIGCLVLLPKGLWSSLTTESFKFKIYATETRYTTISHDEISKNHPGGLNKVESTGKEV